MEEQYCVTTITQTGQSLIDETTITQTITQTGHDSETSHITQGGAD